MFKAQDLAKAMNAAFLGNGEQEFTGVSTDSRKITPGQLFVALKGESFDGHAYCAKAIELGAKGVVISSDVDNLSADVCVFKVADTLKGYQDIAHYYRSTLQNTKIFAITGSNGKTSTKDLLAACLSQKYKVITKLHDTSNLSITKLCEIAKVSKSSYYKWQKRTLSEENSEIIELIKQIYWANNGKFGYRRITMEIRRKYALVVNHKKVLRCMQELGLKSKIRKTKQHAKTQRKLESWTIAENLLKSNFTVNEPNKIFSTDVTYLILKNNQRFYFSVIKDLGSCEIVAYSLSDKNNIDLEIYG